MKIIADSGSTKCDWKIIDNKGLVTCAFYSQGLNPVFVSSKQLVGILQKVEELKPFQQQVNEVRFYGAACSSKERNSVIHEGLASFFNHAEIFVEHDLLAAALATCDNREGIACILGTGSNAGYFDGQKLYDENIALGYILGDEGSGSYFGKKLLADFIYGLLPKPVMAYMSEKYGINKEIIIEHVYYKPFPNVYLAGFAKVLSVFKEDPYIRNMIYNGFETFIKIHVERIPNYKDIPVHFVGSIAFIYQEILREVASNCGIQIGKIIKKPIDELVLYHANHQS
jgi:N-acetylglucosamine kinase-like BadF-type ATPase